MDLESFRNPPAAFRSMPLWVWNGEMTEGRITEMLGQFAAQGMGGVFVHPRPGLITEYLSERWFELWNHALGECRRLGLECNVYDENSYPAGFAGGHVPARAPHTVAQYVEAVKHRGKGAVRYDGELLGAHRILATGAGPVLAKADLAKAAGQGPVLTLALRRASGNPWTAWFPMTDITRPEVAREFIATTYEPYAARFKNEFGRTITSIFCDEPLIATAGAYSNATGLPMSRFILAEFRKEHQYDLLPKLADLFVDQEGAAATRFDYYLTLQHLWTGNFMKPLHEWCTAHGLRLTGHYMEQEWPCPIMNPSCMEGYRWMHMPGVDMLAPQFDFEHPERSAHFLMTVRELNSAANQLGLSRRFCETHGVGGYGATFEDFKRLSDWLMVHGVNFISQHLSFQTIGGARKYDHPQTFSDHSPWWGSYRLHADHIARLSVLLSQGRQHHRVLVLHSTTSGWVHFNPAREAMNGAAVEDILGKLRAGEAALVQWLADHQMDFDLADELLLADFAHAEGAILHVGQAAYSVIVVPEGMDNWCSSTRVLIEEYLAGGGAVLALREPPRFVDGRPAEQQWKPGAGWLRAQSFVQLQAMLDQRVPRLITMADGRYLPALVGCHSRTVADGETLHFLANHSHAAISGEVRIDGAGIRALDTFTGEVTAPDCLRDGGFIVVPLHLPPAGHVVWLVSESAPALQDPGKKEPGWETIAISKFKRIERTEPNVLGLDFCDLTVSGETYRGLYVLRANKLCWQAHGFDRDVWDRAVQFRRNYVETEFAKDTGFTVEYHFSLAATAAPGEIELAIERPDLYRVEINGRKLSFDGGRRWLDETIRAVKVGNYLRTGLNTVSLAARPFHILCEIDRIYLLGDFALEPAGAGFQMVKPAPLKIGDWTRQGLAQYPGSVRYVAQVALAHPAGNLMIEIPRWAGSVIKIEIDREPAGHIAFPPYSLRIVREMDAGEHELALEVVGTPRNLFGPHFCNTPRLSSWPSDWEIYPAQPAAGRDYSLAPYGLLAPIRFSTSV